MTLQSFDEQMTAEAFVIWSEAVRGAVRHELLDGRVYAMASERVAHARAKNAVLRQLERQIEAKELLCEAFPDGMAVRVDDTNVFEPDVTVRCGPRLPPGDVLILDPVVVVEVASPSTQRVDVLVKFSRYFRNPSLVHYLILVPGGAMAIHHRRAADGRIETMSHDGGMVALDPPGVNLDLTAVFAALA